MIMTEQNKREISEQDHHPGYVLEVDEELLADIVDLIRTGARNDLKNIIADLHPADIAAILNRLDPTDASFFFSLIPEESVGDVIVEMNDAQRSVVLGEMSHTRISELVGEMDSDEAIDVVRDLPEKVARSVLDILELPAAKELKDLLQYAPGTAAGVMGKEIAVAHRKDTVKKAIQIIRRLAKETDRIYNLYVVDDEAVLRGVIPIERLLLHPPARRLYKIMREDVISVKAEVDQEEVAQIFKKYNLVSVPVVDEQNKILGHITADDIVEVMEEEASEDIYKMMGSDAAEMERKSPLQIARMRIPWLLATMAVSLVSGMVVSLFDETLSKVILLASFMPVISAISGNVGLQAAAIIVRGLATGQVALSDWRRAWWREIRTVLLMAGVCGATLGTIAALWAHHWPFGMVVGVSMFASMSTAGTMGTLIPLVSKRLGFDPAVTAGPFETTFQDIVGFGIFLGLSTVLLHFIQ